MKPFFTDIHLHLSPSPRNNPTIFHTKNICCNHEKRKTIGQICLLVCLVFLIFFLLLGNNKTIKWSSTSYPCMVTLCVENTGTTIQCIILLKLGGYCSRTYTRSESEKYIFCSLTFLVLLSEQVKRFNVYFVL